MLKTMRNAWAVPELRKKIIFTVFILLIYRLGCAIPVPFSDPAQLQKFQDSFMLSSDGTILDYLNILSGDAFQKASLFALSISPYITSSIVMQLLTIAIPALERMSKDGEAGRKKIDRITRYVTVALSIITAYGYYTYMDVSVDGGGYGILMQNTGLPRVFLMIVVIASYVAGASLIMWMGEKINAHGIGNGISMILFANIIAGFPNMASQVYYWLTSGDVMQIIKAVVFAIVLLLIVVFVVFITNSERRINVQYAKKVVGRKMYGGQSTTLPIKLNMAGVMPIIFANSIVALPGTIGMMFGARAETATGFWGGVLKVFNFDSPVYIVLFSVLIVAFSYFYIAISFNPVEVSNNLRNNGGFIPGIRPGKPTSDFITKILNKVTLMGALFLGIIAVLPLIVNLIPQMNLGSIAFSGSSLLIVIGVALETVRELEAQITMRHYKGFLE